jgi:hypothetical protein
MATNLAQILPKTSVIQVYIMRVQNFPEIQEPPQNSSRHKDDMKQVPY